MIYIICITAFTYLHYLVSDNTLEIQRDIYGVKGKGVFGNVRDNDKRAKSKRILYKPAARPYNDISILPNLHSLLIMISLTVFVSLALIPFAAAQASSPAFEIEAIKAHFTQSAIVPSLLAAFEPTALLSLNYEG